MSVDVTFRPIGPTVLITNTGGQPAPASGNFSGMVTYRVVNLSTTAATFFRLGYAPTLAKAIANAIAATASGVYVLTLGPSETRTFELPSGIFLASETANTTGFEVTPGYGGV